MTIPVTVEHGIFLHHAEVLPKFPDDELIRRWILRVLRQECCQLQSLHIVFMDDESLLQINREHLNHDYYTDVITFPYQAKPVDAEIYISADRVFDNAQTYGVSSEEELLRVIVHGVLHSCGWTDDTEEARALMRLREDACLTLLPGMRYPAAPSSPSYAVFSASAI
jgi:rRNA maturation RNase YbeY